MSTSNKKTNKSNSETTKTNEQLISEIRENINVTENINTLVLQNMGLVRKWALKNKTNVPLEDKMQYACEGLMNAINNFDLSKDTRFSTYASTSIRNTIQRYCSHESRHIYIPEYLSVGNLRIHEFVTQYMKVHKRMPSQELISEELDISLDNVKILDAINPIATSLDQPLGTSDDDETADFYTYLTNDDDSSFSLNESSGDMKIDEAFNSIKKHLTDDECMLIALYYGLDGFPEHSMKEIPAYNLYVIDQYLTNYTRISRMLPRLLLKIKKIFEAQKIFVDKEL